MFLVKKLYDQYSIFNSDSDKTKIQSTVGTSVKTFIREIFNSMKHIFGQRLICWIMIWLIFIAPPHPAQKLFANM